MPKNLVDTILTSESDSVLSAEEMAKLKLAAREAMIGKQLNIQAEQMSVNAEVYIQKDKQNV